MQQGGTLAPGTSLSLEVTSLAACLRGQRPENESWSWLCLLSIWIEAVLVTVRFLRTQVGSPMIWSDWKCSGPDWDHTQLKEDGMSHFVRCTLEGLRRACAKTFRSDQIRSVAQSCPTLCDPMNRTTPGLPVHHQLPEFTQTHVHRVSDSIQPSHPLSSPSPLAPNPSQHQSLFQ